MVTRPPHAVLPLALVAGAVVLAVAACGGSPATTPSSSAPAGATSTAAAPTSGASASAPTSPTSPTSPTDSSTATTGAPAGGSCAVTHLRVRYATDPGGGGAGSVQGSLTFTNTGTDPCTLSGFPGVSFVGGGNGTQVGAAATRTDETGRSRTLAPGRSVTAGLRRSQPGAYGDDCQPTKVDGLRVYPPGSTEAAFVPFPTTGCKAMAAPLLQVGPVR